MPRLTAVCTCSRPASSRTAARVTRATMASEEIASAIAGRVRWRTLSRNPAPLPSAGNQPSCTANTATSTIAAANDGRAAVMAVPTRVDVSTQPGRRPASTPSPMPSRQMIRDAYSTRPAEVAVQRVGQPVPVLGDERLVEVIPLLQGGHAARRQCPAPGQRGQRGAGREVHRAEDHEAGDQQAGEEHREPAEQELAPAHQPTPPRLFAHGANM